MSQNFKIANKWLDLNSRIHEKLYLDAISKLKSNLFSMKNLIILVCLSACFVTHAQTTIYHPFPESNARWNFDLINAMGMCHYRFSIEVSGDTTINSLIYHQLITHGFVDAGSFGACTQILPPYLGAVRNDTANRKVYFIPASDSTETLLYDFNMQIGDTVPGYINHFNAPTNSVYAIDSVLVNGNYRNRWMVDSCYSLSIIEGIGSDFGLLDHLPGCMTDGNYYQLLCFQINSITYYPTNAFFCGLYDFIPANIKQSNAVRLSPNPSSTNFLIESSEASMLSFNLFDLYGKLIQTEKLNGSHRFTIENLVQGCYMLQVYDSQNNAFQFKLLKIN